MINQILRSAFGQALRQSPRATKAAKNVRVPPRDAGIVGRIGPGGGSLETGVFARPITRPSSVNVRPSNTPYTGTLQPNTAPSYVGSQRSRGFSVSPTGVALGAGGLTGVGLGVGEMGGGRGITGQIEGALNRVGPALDSFVSNLNFPGQRAVEEFGRGQEQRGYGALLDFSTGGLTGLYNTAAGITGLPTIGQGLDRLTNAADSSPTPIRRVSYPVAGDPVYDNEVPTREELDERSNQNEVPTREELDERSNQNEVPSREELERRAYQQEASRVAQQADPFFRAGRAPMVNYTADEGMAINRALYGDMLTPNTPNPLMAGLTYDQTNPTMQGKNYNMENPVGVQQSSAQALSDYYRNGMIEQQTAGMGSEPGLESVLSPEDRSMYLEQLRNFRPGGPGYGR